MSTPKKKKDLLGKVVETKEDALKAIRSGAIAAYIIAGLTGLIGLLVIAADATTGIVLILTGILYASIAWFMKAKKSRTAAVILLSLAALEIIGRIADGKNGLITPLILLWFSIKGVQGTFLWHKFQKK